MKKYEYLPHTADIKIRAFGKTLEEAFTNGAYAVSEEFSSQKKIDKHLEKVHLFAKTKEALLYDFIDQIIFFVDADHRILSSIKEIVISKKNNGYELKCEFYLDDLSEYNTLIKAMTYQEMNISNDKGFVIEFIVDV